MLSTGDHFTQSSDEITEKFAIEINVHKGEFLTLACYQIRKIAGCASAGNAGNVFPPSTSKETAS